MTRCKNCSKHANYNVIGEKKAIYCNEHKLDGMIDVKNKRCISENCNTQPNFNFLGKKAIYCSKHKLDGMIDVTNKRCISENCNTCANFNVLGKKAIYCSKHKSEGMIDVNCKKCVSENCNTRPTYNVLGKKAIYCNDHKLDGMIDVINKRCISENCNTLPNFNFLGKKAIYCNEHKLNGMIDVTHRRCIFENCNTLPTYNFDGKKKAIYCNHHKFDGMINVKDKKCNTLFCLTLSSKKYNGYCLPCCIQVHPEIKVSRNYKTKEKDVVDRITQTFTSFTWIADKKVQYGCSLRRPDLLLDMGSHIIIVEVDENKHTDYDCSCENKRLMELSQDLQHRPIVFIRFNPDDYTNQDGILVKSCWKLNKLGVMQITKTKQKEWEDRIKNLKQQIQYWIDNKTEKTIEIIELFY
jgi:hypothetical protein